METYLFNWQRWELQLSRSRDYPNLSIFLVILIRRRRWNPERKGILEKNILLLLLGTLTAMSFEINENLRDFYIYSTSTENSISSVQLEYKIGEGELE